MFGRVPGLVQFAADPMVWRELFRLRGLSKQRYGSHLQSRSVTAPIAPFAQTWTILTMHKIARFNGAYVFNSFIPPFPSKAFETMIFRPLSAIESRESHTLVVPPLSTHLAITTACPLHCWHCSKANRPGQRDLPTERWLEVLSELQEWGVPVVAFTGGEPLVHPRLEEMIARVKDRATTYIFTSGFGLTTEKAQQLKKAGLFGILVSLDHYDQHRHDEMRGYKGAFANAIKGLEASRNAGIYTMVQIVVTRELLRSGGLGRIFELGRRMRIHEIRILPPIATGQLLYAGDDVLLSDEERNQVARIDKQANGWLGYPKVTSSIRVESPEVLGCGAGSQHSYIDAAGNVSPCDFVPLSFGSVAERNFRDIWSEVNSAMGEPRSRCFMLDNAQAIRQSANGRLPLPPDVSRRICKQCKSSRIPGFFQQWGQMWS